MNLLLPRDVSNDRLFLDLYPLDSVLYASRYLMPSGPDVAPDLFPDGCLFRVRRKPVCANTVATKAIAGDPRCCERDNEAENDPRIQKD